MAGFNKGQGLPTKDSPSNKNINQTIGNKEDNPFSDNQMNPSIIGHLKASYYHVHNPSVVYPIQADPIQLTAGIGAWTEGSKVEIIASGAKNDFSFDIHHVILGDVSSNDDYEVRLYTGESGSEVLWGTCAFTRDSNQVKGSQIPIQGSPILKGTRISATLSSGDGSNTANIKIYTHEYPII